MNMVVVTTVKATKYLIEIGILSTSKDNKKSSVPTQKGFEEGIERIAVDYNGDDRYKLFL